VAPAARAAYDFFLDYRPTDGELYVDPLDALGLPVEVANILKEERATAAFFKDFVASGVWHIDPKKGLCKTDAGRVEGTHSAPRLWEDYILPPEEFDDAERAGAENDEQESQGSSPPLLLQTPALTPGLHAPLATPQSTLRNDRTPYFRTTMRPSNANCFPG